jgi:hypothetical protein
MKGYCKECQRESDINPYIDSPYYKVCFNCQMRLSIDEGSELLKKFN